MTTRVIPQVIVGTLSVAQEMSYLVFMSVTYSAILLKYFPIFDMYVPYYVVCTAELMDTFKCLCL